MKFLRKLRWVLYPSVFILVFIFGSYCSFPEEVVRKLVDGVVLNAAMAIGPKERGLPNINMNKVSLWRGTGISIDGLKIIWPPSIKSTALNLNFDSLKGRVGIFSLLTNTKTISSKGDFYGGYMDSEIRIRMPNNLASLNVSLEKIDLAKMDFIETLIGAPLKGILDLMVDVDANSQLSKDGTGTIKVNLENGVFGPGNLNLPAGGFVSSLAVPLLNLGKLTVDLSLDKGQVTSKTFTLTGGDLEAEMQLLVSLGRVPQVSRLDGTGWFSLKKEFLAANETFKMLFDLIPELRAAQQGDGKVGFSVRGSVSRPQFKLESSVGLLKPKAVQPPDMNE